MNGSCLYVGEVRHRRLRPELAFRYGVYFLFLDLDELEQVAARSRLFSHRSVNGRAPLCLVDADHGPRDGSPLRPWIDRLLAREGIDLTGGRVFLLTFPRVLGFRFYPVSVWYCVGADGGARAILAEVQNTFHQHHNYLLHRGGDALTWGGELSVDKVFHVSPFIGMNGRYTFHFGRPDERLSVDLLDTVDGSPLLMAGLRLRREDRTDAALARCVGRYGPMSARAWTLIRWQALRLLKRRVPYLRRPGLPPQETT
jgi:DUF1365 family protein